jgi:hypothetical protein
MSYEQRLKFLKLKSLENRKYIQILTIIFNIKTKSNRILNQWYNEININNNNRNGTVVLI